MMKTRDELLEEAGFQKGHFDAVYDFWSHQTHIFSLSFYRIEANGRGTGKENEAERDYIGGALSYCANVSTLATDMLVEVFPYVQKVRKGVKSAFSRGPNENRPRPFNANKQKKKEQEPPPMKKSPVTGTLESIWM